MKQPETMQAELDRVQAAYRAWVALLPALGATVAFEPMAIPAFKRFWLGSFGLAQMRADGPMATALPRSAKEFVPIEMLLAWAALAFTPAANESMPVAPSLL